ncbi:MAG: diguanylate cyclase [Bacteriovoracia bacterium]
MKPPVYNVLLMEADPKEAEIYSDVIREVGECKIDVMSRVRSTFDWLVNSNYHLIVIDLSSLELGGTPRKLNGITLLERIKRNNPDTSVIIISDRAKVADAVAAIRMGAEDFLEKPFNLETLKLVIKRGLDKKTVFGENTGASGFLHLLNSCQMISASLEQSKIFSIVQGYFSQELNSNHSSIYTLHQNEPIRALESAGDNRTDRAMEEILDIAIYATNPFPKMVEADEVYRFIDRGKLTPGLFVFRFKCAGESDYFCVCLSPTTPTNTAEFENQIHLLRRQLEVTGNNIKQYLGVQHLVYVDDATGLYNTRYLNYILDREIKQAKAENLSFAVLFADADKFKGVNDNHGHLVGTKLLNELGYHIKKHVRDTDTVFRYGGDEFVAVLTPCDLAMAQTVAERIRKSVEKNTFLAREGLNIHFTVSIGVAMFPDHATSKKDIIEMADKAMYHAKKLSRNRVYVVSGADTVQPVAVGDSAPALKGATVTQIAPKKSVKPSKQQ